jgi:hypothetical protein
MEHTAKGRMRSDRGVARQPWHAIEIAVVAGKVDDRLILHGGRGNGIIGHQTVQLGEGGSQRQDVPCDGQDFNPKARYFIDRLTETRKLLYFGWMLLQSPGDAGH